MTSLPDVSQAGVPERPVHGPHLAGIWRILGNSAWVAVLLLSLLAWILAIYVWNQWDRATVAEAISQNPKMTADDIHAVTEEKDAIHQLGLSLPVYADFFSTLRVLAGIPFFFLSLLIVRRRSDRLMAVLFAMFLAAAGAAGRFISPNWQALGGEFFYPWMAVPVRLLSFILNCSIILLYTFPDGRFVPRWTRWLALFVIVWFYFVNLAGNSAIDMYNLPGPIPVVVPKVLLVTGVFAFIYRYRRDASRVQKQQLKWVVASFMPLMLLYFIQYFTFDFPIALTGQGLLTTSAQALVFTLITEPLWYVGQVLLAVAFGLAVFRYRLWDIDLIINRTLVYASLTGLTILLYVLVVGALGAFFHASSSPLPFFLATGLVAIVFEPLRRRIQGGINHLMYGKRDDPYQVLSSLTRRLEQILVPGAVLPALVETVAQALKLPYVSVQLKKGEEIETAASYGKPVSDPLRLALVYQNEAIGELLLGRRAAGEEFSPQDQKLLADIARVAGTAAYNVLLTSELQRSRARVVTGREEERRRLRRDLHDGLGPILASQGLKLAAISHLVDQDPSEARRLLDNVIQQNENTVGDLRRLVSGLRPPALDELGLANAIREQVLQPKGGISSQETLQVQVEVEPENLPPLPAAVEVNAYRITLEALTNVIRHAQASNCHVRIALIGNETQAALELQVSDDGRGIPSNYLAGVGLASMRERAEEIGGKLSVQAAPQGGTQVVAWLPLAGGGLK
jgi:signal transduction histidine kinase